VLKEEECLGGGLDDGHCFRFTGVLSCQGFEGTQEVFQFGTHLHSPHTVDSIALSESPSRILEIQRHFGL
jgi:hypothetical protein